MTYVREPVLYPRPPSAKKPASASAVRTARRATIVEDYAVAMLDELEQPKHVRQRFTVGY